MQVIGNKIYLFGGRTNYRSYGNSSFQCFDTETNTITTLNAKLSDGKYGMCSAVFGTKVYLFDGMQYDNMYSPYTFYYDGIYEYDIENDTLITLSIKLPAKTGATTAAIVGSKVYLFGGQNKDGYLSDINIFTISMPLVKDVVYMIPSLTNNVFTLIGGNNSIRTGIEQVFIGNKEGYAEQVNAYLYNENTAAWELI